MNICHCDRLVVSHNFDPDKCGRTPEAFNPSEAGGLAPEPPPQTGPTCSQCGEPCSEIEIREHNPDIPGFEWFVVSDCCSAAIEGV